MRWAAAARPTGPPPITAIGRGSKRCADIFYPSGIIEILGKKERPSGGGLLFIRGATSIGAALVHQEPNQAAHGRIVGSANQCGRLPFLSHQSRRDQSLEMMRQC